MKIHLKINLSSMTVLALLLLFTQQAFALGKVGHKVICQVAFDHLNQTTQHKINTLLKELPKSHKKLLNKYNHKSVKHNISFAESCTWADAIKKDKLYNRYKKWHYVNVARDQTKITQHTCQKNCVTSAIKYHRQQLSILPTSWEKLQALLFLGHWLGDIHQPMHVNFASDLGGNRTKILMGDQKCNNMHWLWDECLLYSVANKHKPHKYKPNNAQLFNHLHSTLSNQWKSAPINTWQQASIYEWATESLTIARLPSVLYCVNNKDNKCEPLQNNKVKLPINYQEKHQPLLEKRMLQAAVRLRYMLENILK